ncbi:hypothetical protein [Microvirga roseola]|uniref:hypothetical protein n=1 Tax=Microvirga roseola TaxID=2883126 RepID=UPI0038991CF7
MLAPRGAALRQLLKNCALPGRLVITSPTLLRRAVFRLHARAIAYRAANALPDWNPHLSSRDRASAFQIGGIAILALLLVTGGILAPGPTLAIATGTLSLSSAWSYCGWLPRS